MKQTTAQAVLDQPLLHPLLIALYPGLSLWLVNFDQIEPAAAARPAAFALGVTLAAFLAGLAFFRGARKAALFASLFAALFFSYGQVFDLIDMKTVMGFVIGRHRYLIALWLGLFGAGAAAIWRARQAIFPVTRILNAASLFLLALTAGQIVSIAVYTRAAPRASVAAPRAAQTKAGGQPQEQRLGPKRDVYLIVVDAHARQDVLLAEHGLDNAAFIEQLRGLGFAVMDCAQSNYGYTPLSMGALLNMEYMDTLGVRLDPQAGDLPYWEFQEMLSHSRVRSAFDALGYRTVTFKPLYPWMDAPDSDIYLDVEQSTGFFEKQSSVNFHYLFLRTSAMRVLLEVEEHSPDAFNRLPPWLVQVINPKAGLLSSRNLKQFEQNRYALDTLAEAAAIPGPKFFYAHLFITHRPYVFTPDGGLRWPVEGTMQAYNDQVRFADHHLIAILERLIRESAIPPVIVLQSDHGYADDKSPNRMKILNAYYLPEGGMERLYPTITPVNTFRLIFSHYFGENLPLREDRSYYSPPDHPAMLEETPILCPAEQ